MKSKKRTKLTDEHFAIFQTEAEYWLDRFSLRNWKVFFGRIPRTEAGFADCDTNYYNRVGSIRLAESFEPCDEVVLPLIVPEAAFHEVCELLLQPLRAMSRFGERDTDEAIHEVIRRLEQVVFRPDWERRQQPHQPKQEALK